MTENTRPESLNGGNSLNTSKKGETPMGSVEKEQKRITRREFVRGAAVVAGAGALASCTAPTPEVITKDVIVEKEVLVTVEVEKEVVVEKEVIKEVPAGAGPVTLEVYDPSGAFEVTQLHVPRLDTLAGKTICGIGSPWEFHTTFALISELLQSQFPTATFIPSTDLTKFPDYPGASDWRKDEKIGEKAIAAGCDAVIIGNAG